MSNEDTDEVTRQLEESRITDKDDWSSGLSFSDHSLKLNTYKDGEVIKKALEECKELRYLKLNGNTIGVDAADAIGDGLMTHSELKRAIWDNMFISRSKDEIPYALKHLSRGVMTAGARLVELQLSDNAIGPVGMKGLIDLLKSASCSTLEELKLENTGLGVSGARTLSSILCNSVTGDSGPHIRVLIMGRNRLENEGAIAMAKYIKMNKHLEVISMPQNGIFHPGIKALSEAFMENKNLKSINLNDNVVGEKGALALSNALQVLTKLQMFNVGDCLIKTEGAISIANAIRLNHTELEELNFDYNEIKLEGGIALAEAMTGKTKMRELSMSGNRFGQDGTWNILHVLSANNPNILYNDSDDEGSSSPSEEEEDDDEEDETEDEEDREEEDGEEEEDVGLQSDALTRFLETPSAGLFKCVGDNLRQVISDYLERTNETERLKVSLKALLSVSSLDEGDELFQEKIVECCTGLYEDVFKYAIETEKAYDFFNDLVPQLRLLKAEDKESLLECNIKACLTVLKKVLLTDTIPEPYKGMLQFIITTREVHVVNA